MSPVSPAMPVARGTKDRLGFIDALRASIVAFVIVHHAAQAYGPTGGFRLVSDSAQSDWFAPFYTVNSAFGLGLLFLLAGYFVPGSYDRKGAWGFLKGRWARLGVPLLAWLALVQLPALYLFGTHPPPLEFFSQLLDQGWLPLYGHLWFLTHLLLYSALYAAWCMVWERSGRPPIHWPPPNTAVIVGFVLVLALATWIVRIRYPVDQWVPLLWIMPVEPAHLPQYVALFAAGIVAARNDWFISMPVRTGMIWLCIGLVVSAGVYIAHLGGPLSELFSTGGLNVSSLARSTWETTIVAGLSVGLVVTFRELVRQASRWTSGIAAASFGAYLVHLPIVVALQVALLGVTLPAWAKFSCVSAIAIVLSFGISHLASRVPGVRTVLGGGSRSA